MDKPKECLYSTRERFGIKRLCDLLYRLQLIKGESYGNSWEKRGEVGVLHNIFRKVDRIENIVMGQLAGKPLPSGAEESLTATIADLAVYSLLWLDRMMEIDPAFLDWYDSTEKAVQQWEYEHLGNVTPKVVKDA